MVTFSNPFDILNRLCLAEKKHGLYVSVHDDLGDIQKWAEAAPFLRDNSWDLGHKLLDRGYLFLLFDTAEERDRYFHSIVGEKPSSLTTNPYRGPIRIFAYTASPEGKGLDENC